MSDAVQYYLAYKQTLKAAFTIPLLQLQRRRIHPDLDPIRLVRALIRIRPRGDVFQKLPRNLALGHRHDRAPRAPDPHKEPVPQLAVRHIVRSERKGLRDERAAATGHLVHKVDQGRPQAAQLDDALRGHGRGAGGRAGRQLDQAERHGERVHRRVVVEKGDGKRVVVGDGGAQRRRVGAGHLRQRDAEIGNGVSGGRRGHFGDAARERGRRGDKVDEERDDGDKTENEAGKTVWPRRGHWVQDASCRWLRGAKVVTSMR